MYYCTSAIYIPGCTPDKQLRIRLATAGEEKRKSEMQPKTLGLGGEVKLEEQLPRLALIGRQLAKIREQLTRRINPNKGINWERTRSMRSTSKKATISTP